MKNYESMSSGNIQQPSKTNTIWKKVGIGCGIIFILSICCLIVAVILYSLRDKIPGLDSLTSGITNSSSGNQIAFTSYRNGEGDIFVMNIDGTNLIQLTDHSANDTDAEWSPDGRKIAFTSDRDGNNEIYLMDADGQNISRLTNNDDEDASPAFSPDGSLISFLSNRSGNYEIYTMKTDGGDQRALTNTPAAIDLDPTWSPDGNQIVFASGANYQINLWKISVDGTNLTQITFDDALTWFPTWCSNGLIIYETNRYNNDDFSNFDIVSMRPNGSDEERLTFTTSNDSFPECSPDGTQIAFVSNRDGNFEIYIMAIDGSSIKRITNNAFDDGAPSWKP